MSRLLTPREAQEFKEIIDNYQPNDKVLEKFRSSNFVVIAGPAGSGKDTLRDALILRYPEIYAPVLSTTSRPKRPGESEGRTYHFWDIEGIRMGIERREFFQVALVHNQQVSCLHVNEIENLKPEQCGLSILIPTTETELRLIKNNIKTVFLVPPNITVLKQRLNANRVLDPEEINRRLEAAKKEIEYALKAEYYYCIVTDTVENTTNKVHAFIQSGTTGDEDAHARLVMKEMLNSLHS